MTLTNLKRCVCGALCVLLLASLFGGCSGEKMIDFIYPFKADVNSYDPQIASTTDELLIIENTFEGLIRIDDDGTVNKGVADSWDISADGLTYTFHLKKGIKWNINTDKYESGENAGKFKDKRLQMLGYEFNPDITAKDFVFALQRAVAKETDSPLFSSVSAIQNAPAVHAGKAKANTLGVQAPDDYTLVIQLSSPDSAFMQTLSGAVAMPCNEEFFLATKGRYGLDTKYTLFNGQFYVKQILESSYLLKKNDYYTGDTPAQASELTLKIVDEADEAQILEKLESGYYDAAFISGRSTEKLDKLKEITYQPYQDTTWAFLINTQSPVFQSKAMRQAFCLGFTREEEHEKSYFQSAQTLTPSAAQLSNQTVSDAIGATIKPQDIDKSIALWQKGLTVLGETEITVTVLTPESMETETKALLQGIESGIGTVVKNNEDEQITFTLKVETLSEEDLKSAVAAKNYDVALYPYQLTDNNAVAFLQSVIDSNRSGFNTDKAEKALENAAKAGSAEDKIKYTKQAEKAIINSYSVCPMLYETSYYAAADGVSGIQFHAGTGRVSFIHATRK